MSCAKENGIEMTDQSRQKQSEAWDRYLMRRAARLSRERRESTLMGKTVKEVKRCVTLAIDRVRETIPCSDPWDSDDWMDM